VPDGEAILIADDPAEFADAVVTLLDTPDRRERLAEQARALMMDEYSWATVAKRFLTLLNQAVTRDP
jgi:glycosyltransferase involved in cell wall biosynthesis